MLKVVTSGTITGIDLRELNLLHYFVSFVTCYSQFYCSVFEVSKLGRTIESNGIINYTAEPAAAYGPSTHIFV